MGVSLKTKLSFQFQRYLSNISCWYPHLYAYMGLPCFWAEPRTFKGIARFHWMLDDYRCSHQTVTQVWRPWLLHTADPTIEANVHADGTHMVFMY